MSWGIEALDISIIFKHDVTPGFSETRRYCVNSLFSTLKRRAVALWGQFIGYQYIYYNWQFHKDRICRHKQYTLVLVAFSQLQRFRIFRKTTLNRKLTHFWQIFSILLRKTREKYMKTLARDGLTLFTPTSYFYTPWKLKVFWRFQGVYKKDIGVKRVNNQK